MIILENCFKYFHRGTASEVKALNGINLHVKEGDFVTVIGSNGSGKSSALNCIGGSFLIDSGKLTICGKDMSSWPEYKRAEHISRVFQDPMKGTCPAASIEQNMSLALRRGMPRRLSKGVKPEYREIFQKSLSSLDLGLEDRLKDMVGLLSGGQRQAITMLMATLRRPDVLLLDEHIAALDPKTAHQIMSITKKIVAEQKLTTLMITHNMRHAIDYGNRLIMLHQGQVLFDISGQDKKELTVDRLLQKFYQTQGEELSSDTLLFG
ncbi:MAG: ATP-binding cassette domain-containing protein [Desulfotalea sp.]